MGGRVWWRLRLEWRRHPGALAALGGAGGPLELGATSGERCGIAAGVPGSGCRLSQPSLACPERSRRLGGLSPLTAASLLVPTYARACALLGPDQRTAPLRLPCAACESERPWPSSTALPAGASQR